MTLDIVRRIRGNLHGSVDISELEDRVIAHPIFQRLRRIKQTAFLSFVFPGASHTRFEHSLGVMTLAGIAWGKLRDNQKRLLHSVQKYPSFRERERKGADDLRHGILSQAVDLAERVFASDYILQTLRLAALLHDLGHPPFSHSGERFLPNISALIAQNPTLPDYLMDYFRTLQAKGREYVSHEMYTIMLVDKLLSEVYAQNPSLGLKVAPQDVVSVITPGVAPVPGSELVSLGVHKLCHELISGEIDIDRMDYLLRDSRECGVVYGIFDLDRIMDSLAVYYDEKQQALHLAIQFSGLAAFEDSLRARQSMYLQLYFHKTSVGCEAMLQHLAGLLPDYRLPGRIEDYVLLDETNWMRSLQEAGDKVLFDDTQMQKLHQVIRDLFYDRRLWKRVYELTSKPGADEAASDIERAKEVLRQAGIPFEQISPKNSLTKFRPRKDKEKSRNYLRLIKKDGTQFPRVVPIEDYLSLISGESAISIDRLYVEENRSKEARAALMASFLRPIL